MNLAVDLHNHSCLSPCGSLEMSPSVLARLLAAKGIGLGALTDHNSVKNLPAWAICAKREGIIPLFGMEAQTLEEVHIVCLFSDLEAALDFGAECRELLPPIPNNYEAFGDQVVVDENEDILGEEERWLGNSLAVDADLLCALAIGHGGIVIPAHIDRPAFAMIAQLGFLPDGPYAAVETMRWPIADFSCKYPVISGSDAHYPEHVGRRPFLLETGIDFIRSGEINLSLFAEALMRGTITHGSSGKVLQR